MQPTLKAKNGLAVYEYLKEHPGLRCRVAHTPAGTPPSDHKTISPLHAPMPRYTNILTPYGT